MFNSRLIFKILGTLLWIEAAFMMLSLILALCYQESDIMPFAVTIALTALVGTGLRLLLGRHAAVTPIYSSQSSG